MTTIGQNKNSKTNFAIERQRKRQREGQRKSEKLVGIMSWMFSYRRCDTSRLMVSEILQQCIPIERDSQRALQQHD